MTRRIAPPWERRGLPSRRLLVAVVLVGSIVANLGAVAPGHASAPAPTSSAGSRAAVGALVRPAAPRPSTFSASVLSTTSLVNGSVLPGEHRYFGGGLPGNLTVVGQRVFDSSEFSGNEVVLNASTGAFVADPTSALEPVGAAYDPTANAVFVADAYGNRLVEVSPLNGSQIAMAPIPGNGTVAAVAYDAAQNQLLLLRDSPASLEFVSPTTLQLLATVAPGVFPVGVAIDPTSGLAFVGDGGNATLTVVKLSTRAVLGTVTVPGNVLEVGYAPVSGQVYAVCAGNDLTFVNGTSRAVVANLSLSRVGAATYDAADGSVLALATTAARIYRVNATTDAFSGLIATSNAQSTSIAYAGATRQIFVSYEYADLIDVLNATTGNRTASVNLGTAPSSMALVPAAHRLFVENFNSNNVSVIDTLTEGIVGSIPVSAGSLCVAYDPATGLVDIGTAFGGIIEVDPGNDTVVATLAVPGEIGGIEYVAATSRLYVLTYGNEITVLDAGTMVFVTNITLTGYSGSTALSYDTADGDLYALAYNSGATLADFSGSLVRIDPGTDTATLPGTELPVYAYDLTYDPGADLLLATGAIDFAPELYEISPGNGSVVAVDPSGSVGGPGAWIPSAGLFALPNGVDDALEFLQGATTSVLQSIPLGSGVYGAVLDPTSDQLYVLNYFGSSISTIQLVTTPDVVTLAVRPSLCPVFALADASAGSPVTVDPGAYDLTAPGCFGYAFAGWSADGALSVGNVSAAATSVTVLGNGSLAALYLPVPGAHYAIRIAISPSACAAEVALDGGSVAGGSSAGATFGNHTVVAGNCSGFAFQGWNVSGNLSLTLAGPEAAILHVVGNGTVALWYRSAPTAPSSSSPGPGGPGSVALASTQLAELFVAGLLGGALGGLGVVAVVLRDRPRGGRPPDAAPPAAT